MKQLVLAVLVVGVLLVGGVANAAITATRDSADFDTKSWEGGSVPAPVWGDLSDWSASGGNYLMVQDGTDGVAGSGGAFSSAAGWTAEWRMKLDPANLPTSFDVAGRAAMNVLLVDDSTSAGHFQVLAMGRNNAGQFVVFDNVAGNALLFKGGLLEDFHTVRLAVEGSGGDDEIKLYVDGVEVASPAGAVNGSYNRQWFGDEGAVVSSGTAIVDYFRYDTTGAYAPVPIPWPTKHSIDFDTKNWEGNSVPAPVLGDLSDWSASGGNYVMVQDGTDGMAGSGGAFSFFTGWTAEWRMKLDPANLPTHYPNARAAMDVHLADDSDLAGHFQILCMGRNLAGEFVVFDLWGTTLLFAGGLLDEFHTVRLAVGGGVNGDIKLYVDGAEVTAPTGGVNAGYNRQWFGDEGAVVSSGTAIVDYFRYDTTGAYAIPVPGPATVVLLALGSLLVLFRKRGDRRLNYTQRHK